MGTATLIYRNVRISPTESKDSNLGIGKLQLYTRNGDLIALLHKAN